jgi:hypothetical protein
MSRFFQLTSGVSGNPSQLKLFGIGSWKRLSARLKPCPSQTHVLRAKAVRFQSLTPKLFPKAFKQKTPANVR